MSGRTLGLFAIRGLAHGVGVMLWFFAMARIPIAEVTALNYLSPIYVAIGAALFLGERLAARRIAAILVAFLGAMIILRPGFQELNAGQTAMVIVAPIFALSYLLAKPLAMGSSAAVVVGMLTVCVTVVLAPFAIAVWVPVTVTEVFWLTIVAVFATAGHWTMTKALAAAPIAVTQPVTFLQLVWATTLGAVVFAEPVDAFILAGGAIIIAAVSFISYREWMLSRSSTPSPISAKGYGAFPVSGAKGTHGASSSNGASGSHSATGTAGAPGGRGD
ncbi:MAG: DMT family transporter, partial [Pseudomonadota bacterium]